MKLLLKEHDNEVLPTIRHQDYKNSLRLHITEQEITLYPIGIRKVPRRWKREPGTKARTSLFEPAAVMSEQQPFLIEPPLVIPLCQGKRSAQEAFLFHSRKKAYCRLSFATEKRKGLLTETSSQIS
ncbi:MAG: hypothetical protein LPK03_08265 [Pontibacter sp.]|nr:hypothetical protein [Pontibacter sp.]